MRAADTNVLIRLITRDDSKQLEAAEAFVRHGAWISHLVLAETAWVLTSVYEVRHAQLAAAIELLLDHRELAIQEPDVVAAALARFRRRPTVGFTDCLVLEIARRNGHGPLGTFDGELGKLEGAQRI
jgi:predicted nucleic-acid-binding protein